MTPQSTFMIVAKIDPRREAELRGVLAATDIEAGGIDPSHTLLPFAQFMQLHFARIVILDDQTLDDITVYGLTRIDYPKYLVVLGELDGPLDEFFSELAQRAGEGLRRIFSYCDSDLPDADLFPWLMAHNCTSAANYVNWLGRTVQQVREEEALRQSMETFLQQYSDTLSALQPRQVLDTLRKFVGAEQQSGRILLTPPQPTPVLWRFRAALHLVGVPLLLLMVSPLLVLCLPFFLIQLRRLERSDPVLAPRVDPAHADLLASHEDHDVVNPFTAMGSLKPGLFRRFTITSVLMAIDYTARHIFNRGRLARVTTIHFARWVFLDGGKRVIFTSNYDGSLESYMDDFINKVGFGLNVVFSGGIGYPKTNWLLLDGAKDEQKFKDYLRRHQVPTQVWYNAHPGLTALDKRRNALIRDGIERSSMTDLEIDAWLKLL